MSIFNTSLNNAAALPNSADAFGFKSRFSSPPPKRTSFDDAIGWRVTRTPLFCQSVTTPTLPTAPKLQAVPAPDVDVDMEDLATPHLQWRSTPLIPKADKKADIKDAAPKKMDVDVPTPLPRRRAPSTLAALVSAGAPQRFLPPTIQTDLATAFAAVSIGAPPLNVQAPASDILDLAKAFEGLGMRDRVPTWREPAPMVVDEDDEDDAVNPATQGPAAMDVDEVVDVMDIDAAAAAEDPNAMEVELPPCGPSLCNDPSILHLAFHAGCYSFGVRVATPAKPSTLDTYLSVKLSWAALL